MLNDEDAREFAYEPLWESLSEPLVDAGRTFSSCKAGTPLATGGLRPKGLRKGGMADGNGQEYVKSMLGKSMHSNGSH